VKLTFSIFLFLSFLVSYAQGEANIWYFGENAGLDFNSGVPVALTDGQLNSNEGTSVLSNASGELMFYTNGVTVYNKNHVVMPNGTGLFGDTSSTQSSLILQKPNAPNLYYLFTVDDEAGVNGFCYSVIDINLDAGLGAVTSEKNIPIYTPTCEKLTAVKHANNIDYWIITHGWNSNIYYSYLLTENGLDPTPVQNSTSLFLGDYVVMEDYAGAIKISPDGSKLASCNTRHRQVVLFDFDNATGILSNETLVYEVSPVLSGLYGIEFSIDSKILYATNNSRILQFDLTTNPIDSSLVIINGTDYSSAPLSLQLGPDNKIYVALWGSPKLGVINNPNVSGMGCDFQNNAIDLNGRVCKSGLPNFCQSFFTTNILLQNACVGQNTTFELNGSQNISSAVWNFGDGGTSNVLSPTHVYSAPGNYTVSVVASGPNGTGTNTREITIHPLPVLNSNSINLKQCDDDNDGFSAFNLNQVISLLVNDTTGLAFSFHETLQAAKDNTSAITNHTSYTNQSVSNDVVFVRVQNANGCYETARINLQVSTTLIPSTFQKVFTECDDVASGSNIDGVATFDFSSVTAEVQALYPAGQLLDITYYKM